ncbi:MAG TPA: 23S rRNA (guanosine(2251)-2'-O)-methyltransferase RlmB [Solirubrobacterales bacterium]
MASEVIYGRRPVEEAKRGRRKVLRVHTRDELSGEELERRCGSPDHQGVIAEVEPYPYADPGALLAAEDAIVLALDRVQDPRNLGAICRSAEAAGVAGVVIPDRHAAAVTAAVCKASAGAVEHLAIARVGNLADWLELAKKDGAWAYGAAAEAATPYTEPDYSGRVVIVLGGEEKGIRPRVASACDALVSIPRRGRVGSLNVSAAASVLVFEALRSRPAG